MKHQNALAALAATASWRKASYSSDSGCVEVAAVPGYIGVRDTKLGRDSPILAFTIEEWAAFLAGVRAGEFDGPSLAP